MAHNPQPNMEKPRLIKGHRQLARQLHVNESTIRVWLKRGVLKKSVVCHVGRIILYDYDLVLDELNMRRGARGRIRP